MMKIYLMQHGKPVSKDEDPDRPLSEQGRDDVERVAQFLKRSGATIDEIFHSGKTRARQTAEIVISRLNPGEKPKEKSGLSPLDDVKEIASQVNERDKNLLIAGHLPHLGKLASLLVAGSDTIPVVSFQQGGVVCLERGEQDEWTISWMLIPHIIK
jgi:phosphohistidine phosphatase